MTTRIERSLRDAEPVSFWLDRPYRPAVREPLRADRRAELAIVGGGFAGLWTAVLAKQRDPEREVVLIEGERIGWAASGRNGGFCSASLTHGHANGVTHAGVELEELDRLGHQNLDEIEQFIILNGVEAHFERTGTLTVATKEYQARELRAGSPDYLDRDAVRAELSSPTYLGGVWHRDDTAVLDPAALAWGLADVATRLGVTIVEKTWVAGLEHDRSSVTVRTAAGATVRADRVALATNAFTPLLRRARLYTVPVYDYVLVTEPLTDGQLSSIGWDHRQGVDDSANQFHYYRLTSDNRILFGGYDAIYHFGRHVRSEYDQRPVTFARLAAHFFDTFPQLDGIRFSHQWGGAIDTCTRFFNFYGTALDQRAAYALGFTGLGVGATRFAANVMLDLLDGATTERTRLRTVRRKPLPFPPEPLAYLGIQATRHALASADRHEGRRNLWLRTLDRCGVGFDS